MFRQKKFPQKAVTTKIVPARQLAGLTSVMLGWWAIATQGKCKVEAAALTFFTLLALVPIVLLLSKLIQLLPNALIDIQSIEDLVLALFIPESALLIREFLTSFSSQAHSITYASIPMLILSVLGLMLQLSQALNSIFAFRPRKFYWQFLFALLSLLFGPTLLSLMFSVTAWIRQLAFIGWVPWGLGAEIIGFIANMLVASCVFVVIPSRSLPARLALLGGALLTLGQITLHAIFYSVLGSLVNYEMLYGVFAAIPLFLVWVYSCWFMVLLVASFLQSIRTRH